MNHRQRVKCKRINGDVYYALYPFCRRTKLLNTLKAEHTDTLGKKAQLLYVTGVQSLFLHRKMRRFRLIQSQGLCGRFKSKFKHFCGNVFRYLENIIDVYIKNENSKLKGTSGY